MTPLLSAFVSDTLWKAVTLATVASITSAQNNQKRRYIILPLQYISCGPDSHYMKQPDNVKWNIPRVCCLWFTCPFWGRVSEGEGDIRQRAVCGLQSQQIHLFLKLQLMSWKQTGRFSDGVCCFNSFSFALMSVILPKMPPHYVIS